MSEKLNSFEVERHFLLTLGQNKTLCKSGLYPSLADRYITQSAEGDHDYCQPPSSSVDKEPAATRNFDLPDPSVIPAQQGNLPATSKQQQQHTATINPVVPSKNKQNFCLSNWRSSRHWWNKQI